jgi:hypothetical protein
MSDSFSYIELICNARWSLTVVSFGMWRRKFTVSGEDKNSIPLGFTLILPKGQTIWIN